MSHFFNGCTLLIELTGNGFLALVCLCPLCRNPIIENALIVHCKRLFYTFETEKFWTKEFIFCRLSSFNHNMGVREGVDDTPMIDGWVPQRPSCLKSVSWFFFTTNGTGQCSVAFIDGKEWLCWWISIILQSLMTI